MIRTMKKKKAVVRSEGRGVVKTVDGICTETEWREDLRHVRVWGQDARQRLP